MEKHDGEMEFGKPLLTQFFAAPFFFLWALAIYAFLTSCEPFSRNMASYVAYYGVLGVLILAEIGLFDATFRAQKFVVKRGLIHQLNIVLFVFRFHRQYARADIKDFDIEFRKGFLSGGYFVFLVTKGGKKIRLHILETQEEAEHFRRKLKSSFAE